jgi:hypothetical protein
VNMVTAVVLARSLAAKGQLAEALAEIHMTLLVGPMIRTRKDFAHADKGPKQGRRQYLSSVSRPPSDGRPHCIATLSHERLRSEIL